MNKRRKLVIALGASALIEPLAAFAQTSARPQMDRYPSKPIRLIVPWPPGQATDIAARMMGQKLQEAMGQAFVIDNRPGAGGLIGTDVAAHSPADGYTLLAASSGPMSIMPSLQKLPYDPLKDFVLLGLISRNPYALVINPSFPAANAKEFIALLRANPDKYTFASSGTGATAHLFGELFNTAAGVKARHVPYKGSSPALTDIINGEVNYMVETVASVVGHIRSGRLKALGVTTAKRAGALPGIPTLAEAAGLTDFDAAAWIGYAAPIGTPRDIETRISAEMQKVMQQQDFRERMLVVGLDLATPPDDYAAFMRHEQDRYAGVIKSANIRVE